MSLSVEGIKEMFTIEQIKQAVGKGSTQAEAVSGIVFAYLTNFNIDGNMDQVLALRWYVSCWNLIRVLGGSLQYSALRPRSRFHWSVKLYFIVFSVDFLAAKILC